MKAQQVIFVCVAVFCCFANNITFNWAYADPGQTDEKGGHYDRQTGQYHYHTDFGEEDALRKVIIIEAQAVADAKRDIASSSINSWYYMGFCLGGIGVIAALAATPTVPADKLLGKSPEYVLYYSKAYKSEMRRQRTKNASIGCCVFGCLFLANVYLW